MKLISEQKLDDRGSVPLENRVAIKEKAVQKRPLASLLVKRCLDFSSSLILILLLSPLFILVAIIVVLDDGRPVIHRRRVVSKNGEFDAFKFRSMRRDADAILNLNPALRGEYERNFKLKNDPRITRAGSVLRKFSLDELPQLFNILLGQMSFVGPRMFTAGELGKYGPYKDLILSVKPGLTGYWQVNGRQNVTYEDRVKMDAHYIQNWNLALDFKILLLTPLKVLGREGAY